MKRTVILTALFCSACGSSVPDKDRNSDDVPNNTANNATQNSSANNTTGANNTISPNTAPNNTVGANNTISPPNNTTGPPNNTTGPTNNTTGPANNTTGPPNNTTGPPGCDLEPTFFGQIGGLDEHGGGVPTTGAVSVDAGLSAVLTQVPAEPDDFATVPDEGYVVLTTPVQVTGAIVTATGPQGAGNRRFWLEDANTAIQVFLPVELQTIRVGMAVSFSVLAVQNFEGHAQIAELTGFVIVSEGNAVPYREANNRALSAADYGHIVRFAGTLGAPYDCGGTNCFDVAYPGGVTTLRSRSTFAVVGACANFAGPLGSFPGPRQTLTAPSMQADTVNFDWLWVRD